MPRKSGKTKKNATGKAGPDVAGLTEMTKLLTLAHSSPDTLDENLSRFIEFLDSTGIPPGGMPESALSQVRVLAALVGIARWASLNKETVAAKLKGSWPDIWSWTSCLLRVDSTDVKALAHQACCAVVFHLGVDQDMRELMASTPGTIFTIVRLWVVEQNPTYSADSTILASTPASHAIHMFMELGKPRWFDEIMTVLGEHVEDIAGVVLGTINRRLEKSSKLNISTLYADLAIFHAIWDVRDLFADLFATPAQIIQDTVIRLLCCKGPDCKQAALCLTYCVKYYVHGLLSNHGRFWAYQMFDAPIIRAIVQASIWSSEVDHDLSEALDALAPYLLFRTVLRRAERALDIIHDLNLEKDMKKDGLVYTSFKRYQSLAGARLEIAEGRSLGTRICDNQPCSKVGDGKEFMRCSGCLKVHYCSKECQRHSWKAGNHRELCKLVKVIPDATDDGPECRILLEDHKFLRKVIQHDMKIHRSRIAELKYRLFLSNPELHAKFHLVAVVLDYTKPTMRVGLETDVVGTSLATWGYVDGHKALVTMVDRLESGSGGLIVRSVLPYGKESFPCEFLMSG